jgi:DNA invertase Pin-like site-specific DNA recombinase
MTAKRVALYLRVSTDQQKIEMQREALEDVARRQGWTVAGVFEDNGVSGAKGRDARPAFGRLMKAAIRGEFDMIAAWSVDRIGRSLQDLLAFLGDIHAKGIGLYLHQQGFDTTTPTGKAMFQMMGIFAEFEHTIIVARVRAGVARKRAEGGPWGRPKLEARREAMVRAELAKGTGMLKTARLCGIGSGTVQRIKRAMAAELAAA